MHLPLQVTLLLASAPLLNALTLREQIRSGSSYNLQARAGSVNGSLTLQSNLIQSASQQGGNAPGTTGFDPAQADSLTSNDNFINFCAGKTITNGDQNPDGSCNGIPMGDIPSQDNMISAIIKEPQNGQVLGKNQSFTIQVQTQNLDAGTFTNPDVTYYTAPQQLNTDGNVIGHCHVTVQNIGSPNPQTPPDPKAFDFFLGIENDGNGQGLLKAPVSTGLNPGSYRVCTIMGSSNHQPVLMPVANRGAQDDCVRFQVSQNAANGTAA